MSASIEQALAHPALRQLQARLAARTALEETEPGARYAAVAAVLRVHDVGPELLFIKRAEKDGDPWSGHMAFPGGRQEPGDDSLEYTAVRETLEELALDLGRGVILGRLDDLAPRNPVLPPLVIRPYVAVVPPDVQFVPSAEVADTFWTPIDELRGERAQAEHAILINGARARFPAYRVHGHIVWGLTERIVRQLLPLLDL